jgi:hypothetical protein
MTSINADLLLSATNLSCTGHRRARSPELLENPLSPVTLRRNGVDSLCTRNPAAFAGFGWLHAVDPLA